MPGCSFRHNVRSSVRGEVADCGLMQDIVGSNDIPAVPALACEHCWAQQRESLGSNSVFNSRLLLAWESIPNRDGLNESLHMDVVQAKANITSSLLADDRQHQFDATHSCDVFICCERSDSHTEATINSLLQQQDALAIVHLVDDGGGAANLIGSFADHWNVVIHENSSSIGLYHSVQKFISHCRTQYLAFQSPSVTSKALRLGTAIAELQRTGSELFASAMSDGGGVRLTERPSDIFEDSAALPDTVVMRRATFIDTGGFCVDHTNPMCEFVYRAYLENRRIVLSDDCLAETRQVIDPSLVGNKPDYSFSNGTLRSFATGFPIECVTCDVVMPFRDHVDYLQAAIEGVLAQENADVSIHLIDDASREDTTALLKYWGSHAQVSVYRNSQNIGQYASFNNVVKYLDSDIVLVHDADDISMRHRAHSTATLLSLAGAEYFAAAATIFVDASVPHDVTTDRRGREFRQHRHSSYPARGKEDYFALNPTAAFKTSVIKRLNGYADYGAPARNRAGLDTEFQLRAWFSGVHFAISKEFVTEYRIHLDSAMQNEQTGLGTPMRQQALEERKRRLRLFRTPFDPTVFGGMGVYNGITKPV